MPEPTKKVGGNWTQGTAIHTSADGTEMDGVGADGLVDRLPTKTWWVTRMDLENRLSAHWENRSFWQKVFGFLWIIIIEGAICGLWSLVTVLVAQQGYAPIFIAIIEGMMRIFTLVFGLFFACGHLTPVITFLLYLHGKVLLPWWHCIAHVIGQLLGWSVGVAFVWALTPNLDQHAGLGLGTPALQGLYSVGQGLGAELAGSFLMAITFVWPLVFWGQNHYFSRRMNHERQKAHASSTATVYVLIVGFTHIAYYAFVAPITLASLNPYRYFFPAVMSNQLGGVGWIYLVGPVLALVLAVVSAWLLNAIRSQFGIDFDDIMPVKAVESHLPRPSRTSSYAVESETTSELRSVTVKTGGKNKGGKGH